MFLVNELSNRTLEIYGFSKGLSSWAIQELYIYINVFLLVEDWALDTLIGLKK
jgi:hypothetical protein